MKGPDAVGEKALIGNFVGERVLEGILKVGKRRALVQEFGLQSSESASKPSVPSSAMGPISDRNVLADDRCRVQQPFGASRVDQCAPLDRPARSAQSAVGNGRTRR